MAGVGDNIFPMDICMDHGPMPFAMPSNLFIHLVCTPSPKPHIYRTFLFQQQKCPGHIKANQTPIQTSKPISPAHKDPSQDPSPPPQHYVPPTEKVSQKAHYSSCPLPSTFTIIHLSSYSFPPTYLRTIVIDGPAFEVR